MKAYIGPTGMRCGCCGEPLVGALETENEETLGSLKFIYCANTLCKNHGIRYKVPVLELELYYKDGEGA